MKKVLITYCWNRVGYNILRSLSSHGVDVYVADTSTKNICSMSRFVKGCFVYPDPFTQEDAFIEALRQIVETLRPDVLLPTHDESPIIMRHRAVFPDSLIIPVASAELQERLSDKAQATALAASVGVPTPEVFDSIDLIKSYPVVFKTVIGNSAKTVFFPGDKDELARLMLQFASTKTLIEEKCSGRDYSVDCVRSNNFFFGSVYRALLTKTEEGGTTTQREIMDRPDLVEYAKRMLDAVGYEGVCGFDFKVDENTGKVAFIEVNTRYTGGLATPIAAGFDIPYIHLCLATHQTFDQNICVKIGTKTKWLLGDVITFVGRLAKFHLSWKETKALLDFNFDAFDDYRSDDKRAVLGEMAYYFTKLVKNGKLNP